MFNDSLDDDTVRCFDYAEFVKALNSLCRDSDERLNGKQQTIDFSAYSDV